MACLLDELKQNKYAILTIASHHHAVNVRLFGSVARREEERSSDIDFLVDFQPGSTLWDQLALIDELSEQLGRKVDVVSARALNKHLRQQILQEAVTL